MRSIDNEIDISLWNQFRHGEEASFAEIFRKYYSGLFNYGCRITSNTSLVEDCIQELFLDIWRSAGKAEVTSIKAYIFKAFKYKLIRLIEKNNKITLLADDNYEHAFELSREALVINNDQHAENTKKIMDAVDRLSPRQKEIIYLKFYLSLSYEEVSDVMEINYQAARNLIYKAIKELKINISLVLTIPLLLAAIKMSNCLIDYKN